MNLFRESEQAHARHFLGLGHAHQLKQRGTQVAQLAALGKLDPKDFPLLWHIKELLEDEAVINIPWHAFETEYEG